MEMKLRITDLREWLPSRARQHPVTTIVAHATAGASATSSIAWLYRLARDLIRGNEASYHYIIERDGSVTKCVPITRVAFHAGRSVGPNGPNVNNYSIGIAFANRNDGIERVTPAQESAFYALVTEIRKTCPMLIWVVTHYQISPGRKTDPVGWSVNLNRLPVKVYPWWNR
jgi:N-acetyl-anhydromuramyl-L-alanine amidase AmpD